MESSFLQRHPAARDGLNFFIFVVLVLVGIVFINTFIFRSFNVVGPSMESTMYTGDRLIVNRLPVTWSKLKQEDYVPERGEIIVFRNPQFVEGGRDEFIVKRVVAFPGERVVVRAGKVTVYNDDKPNGFDPDALPQKGKPGSPTSGEVDTVVPDKTLFVIGDHREGNYSSDSRSHLGTIPYFDVVGPVSIRIWPITKIGFF